MPKLLITLNIPCYAPFAHASLPTHTLHSVAYAKAPPKSASPCKKFNFYIKNFYVKHYTFCIFKTWKKLQKNTDDLLTSKKYK